MATVGFERLAASFQAYYEGKVKEAEEARLLESLPPVLPPVAKNPGCQTELTSLYGGYRYSILKAQAWMLQEQRAMKNLAAQGGQRRDDVFSLIFLAVGVSVLQPPLKLQMEETLAEMHGFEDRIVILIEQNDPPPGIDLIKEMQKRLFTPKQ